MSSSKKPGFSPQQTLRPARRLRLRRNKRMWLAPLKAVDRERQEESLEYRFECHGKSSKTMRVALLGAAALGLLLLNRLFGYRRAARV